MTQGLSRRLLRIQLYDSPANRTTILRVVRIFLCNLNIEGSSRKLGAEPKNRGLPRTLGQSLLIVGN